MATEVRAGACRRTIAGISAVIVTIICCGVRSSGLLFSWVGPTAGVVRSNVTSHLSQIPLIVACVKEPINLFCSPGPH
jgi:hypothetical protein